MSCDGVAMLKVSHNDYRIIADIKNFKQSAAQSLKRQFFWSRIPTDACVAPSGAFAKTVDCS